MFSLLISLSVALSLITNAASTPLLLRRADAPYPDGGDISVDNDKAFPMIDSWISNEDGSCGDGDAALNKKIIRSTILDAQQLATHGTMLTDKTSNAFTHYFHKGNDEDWSMWQATMKVVSNNAQDTKYKFKIACPKSCPDGSLAYTDYFPEDVADQDGVKGVRAISFCPAFFTTARTKRVLGDLSDADNKKFWCDTKESKKFTDFETGGHTVLHEMMHLDSLGKAAGLPESKFEGDGAKIPDVDAHGADDWKRSSTQSYVSLARQLVNSKAKNKPECYKNAENHAAAATENLFMSLCDIKNISL